MTKEWDEVNNALQDKSLYTADMETLQRYLRIVTYPPASTNIAFNARLEQAAQTIRHLIAQKENHAQIGMSLKWARIAAWAAIVGVILMLIQLLFSAVTR